MITKPKGSKDIYGKDAKKWQYIEEIVSNVLDKYNYTLIRTPLFEASDLFHRGVGETTDIVSKETYDFVDRGNRNMTLRPEGTAGVVRSFIENKMYGDNLPQKLFYIGPMYRYERPQKGRYREFYQFGMELLGSDDSIGDAEVISAAYNIYKMLGLEKLKVNINSLGDSESREAYHKALVEYLKPHIDELCDDCKERYQKNPLRVLDCKVDRESEILKEAPTPLDYLNKESKERFEKVCEYLDMLKVPYEVNPRLVRGLDYYNHTVFEIDDTAKDMGSQNTIGAGGRYNGLVKLLDGPDTPCMGFAAGIDRVMVALDAEEIDLEVNDDVDLFLMYVNDEEKSYALYLCQELRLAGFRVDTDYLSRSLKAQFKQADRLKAKYTIVLNSEELDNNEVKIKNNKTKEEEIISIDALIYYLDENLEDECDCGDDCHCGDECRCHDHK